MTAGRLQAALALGAFASVAMAAEAPAATKFVDAGGGRGTTVYNDFFRQKVTIHKGDRIAFRFRGFHNIYLPKKGDGSAPLFLPDPTTKYTGFTDPAGAPLWFNGRVDRVTISPASAFPSGGTAYDGSHAVGSGIPQGEGPPKPFVVTFTKKGSFTYFCTIHPGMKGQVKVLPRKAKLPKTAQDARAARKERRQDRRLARKLDARKVAPNTIRGGSDKRPVAQLKFYPANLTVKAGTPIRFVVAPKGQEPHTLSIGPKSYLDDIIAKQFTPVPPEGPGLPTIVMDARVLLPSDPPPLLPFDGATHGGFFSTGVVGGGSPNPKPVTFRISKPGTYTYICLIHPDMEGRITVR
jgi:plastocyanin